MRTFVARLAALAVLGPIVLAAGCVSEEQYRQALAASRRCNEALTACKNAVNELTRENRKLVSDLEARDAVIAARDRSLSELQAAHDKLNNDFKDLLARYQKEVGRVEPPQPVGNIVLPAALDKALRDFAAANPGILEYFPKYGMVKLKSDLTFAPGSVEIRKEAGDALRKFVEIMNTPDARQFNVYIAGHTDDIPIGKPATKEQHPTNWYLSVHRAVAVETVVTNAGLAPPRVGVMGFSEYHPIASNAPGRKGNEANRRVEIWIVPPDRFLTVASGE